MVAARVGKIKERSEVTGLRERASLAFQQNGCNESKLVPGCPVAGQYGHMNSRKADDESSLLWYRLNNNVVLESVCQVGLP